MDRLDNPSLVQDARQSSAAGVDTLLRIARPLVRARNGVAPMTRPAASPGMRVRIIGHLRDGYGADDIAVRLRQHPGFIRRVIAELRAEGVFKQPGFFRPATWGRP